MKAKGGVAEVVLNPGTKTGECFMGVSDIIIKSNKPGYVRLAGKLKPVEMDPITCPEAQAWVDEHVPRIFKQKWDDVGQIEQLALGELVQLE